MKQIPLRFRVETAPKPVLVSAKRTGVERSGLHAWHPYYAGYSEAFVDSALHYLECGNETLVLDPWGGSGTTGLIASREGRPSICIDVNPVMATFAAAKSPEILAHAEEIHSLFEGLKLDSLESVEPGQEPLESILHPTTARAVRFVIDAAQDRFAETLNIMSGALAEFCLDGGQFLNPVYNFCLSVVFVSIRKLSQAKSSANPTWLRNGEKKEITSEEVLSVIRQNALLMLSDLRYFFEGNGKFVPQRVLRGNVREMPIKNESVDRIITSPPYLTRIDYAMSTMPEMFVFGGEDLLHAIRHQTMGAPVITKNGKLQREEWGTICNDVLNKIRNHPTKASNTYYWKNIVQYFMDMDESLDEIWRVLKPGGCGLIVVQSSYFKEIELPLGDIYREFSEIKGFRSDIAFREEVRGHMAHVNSRSNKYKRNKVYFEDFVYIEKPHN